MAEFKVGRFDGLLDPDRVDAHMELRAEGRYGANGVRIDFLNEQDLRDLRHVIDSALRVIDEHKQREQLRRLENVASNIGRNSL